MKRSTLLASALSLMAVSALALGLADRPSPTANAEDAEKAFDALKTLEGTWMLADESGAATDDIGSVYHVTAGGSAIIETMFPGSDHEMVTVYYVEDGTLKMTHYCTLGNRPILTSNQPTEHEMSFECSPEACCSPEDHMHAATITLVDADHVTTAWSSNDTAEDAHAAVFNLIRKADTAR